MTDINIRNLKDALQRAKDYTDYTGEQLWNELDYKTHTYFGYTNSDKYFKMASTKIAKTTLSYANLVFLFQPIDKNEGASNIWIVSISRDTDTTLKMELYSLTGVEDTTYKFLLAYKDEEDVISIELYAQSLVEGNTNFSFKILNEKTENYNTPISKGWTFYQTSPDNWSQTTIPEGYSVQEALNKVPTYSDVEDAIDQSKTYTDENIPSSLPANGGNADTVNGHTVNSDVPANAEFTDTVYTLPAATTSALGGVIVGDNLSVSTDGVLSAPIYSNPNLLDNPDFKINQRGKSNFDTTSANAHNYADYGVDRWAFYNSGSATGNFTVDNGISVTNIQIPETEIPHNVRIAQLCEKSILNTPLTFSILISENTSTEEIKIEICKSQGFANNVAIAVKNIPSEQTGIFSITAINTDLSMSLPLVIIKIVEGVKIQAAKLEIGTKQTLARQDDNGNWILNEIPNPATELMKCQRYFQVLRGSYPVQSRGAGDGVFTTISISPMRVNPSVIWDFTTDDPIGTTSLVNEAIAGWTKGGWTVAKSPTCVQLNIYMIGDASQYDRTANINTIEYPVYLSADLW